MFILSFKCSDFWDTPPQQNMDVFKSLTHSPTYPLACSLACSLAWSINQSINQSKTVLTLICCTYVCLDISTVKLTSAKSNFWFLLIIAIRKKKVSVIELGCKAWHENYVWLFTEILCWWTSSVIHVILKSCQTTFPDETLYDVVSSWLCHLWLSFFSTPVQ